MTEQRCVLIVEDVDAERELILKALQYCDLGLTPISANTVQQAKELTSVNDVAMVVLDRMLRDDIDGLTYLTWLDELEVARPGVLVTSSLGSVHDHVLGLDAGADDYVNKPFEFAELCARLRAVARRMQFVRTPSSVVFFGNLELRTAAKIALIDGIELKLQPKNFRLLQELVMRQGEWISREALWQKVWTDYPGLDPQDAPINNAISRLRKAMSSFLHAPAIVSEDLGYKLAMPD